MENYLERKRVGRREIMGSIGGSWSRERRSLYKHFLSKGRWDLGCLWNAWRDDIKRPKMVLKVELKSDWR